MDPGLIWGFKREFMVIFEVNSTKAQCCVVVHFTVDTETCPLPTLCSHKMIGPSPGELYLLYSVTYKALLVVGFAVEELYPLLRLQYTTHNARL